MAINVTQKDATLNEIIQWCEAHHITRVSEHDMFARGYNQAIDNVATHCRNQLGFTGHMPLEFTNQSEDAHENGACDKQHQELQAVTDEMAARYAVLRYGTQGDGRTLANAGGINAISSEMSYCRSALHRILGISQPASRDLTGWNEEYFESTVNKVLELWRNSETNKTVKEQQ